MKRHTRIIATSMSIVMSASVLGGLAGCKNDRYNSSAMDDYGLGLALNLLGNDAFAWNAFSATPYETFGYVGSSDSSWYSFSGTQSKSEISMVNYMLDMYYDELNHYDVSDLNRSAAITYRSADYILSTYRSYYRSRYVTNFELLGGSYISSEGGYVADFATSFENFEFRNEKDVMTLLSITESTDEAFATYVDYAGARLAAGYPLYDYTINAMRDYLNDVYTKGDDYYLYTVAENKIESADFLSNVQKYTYKQRYQTAIHDDFMRGVQELYSGLSDYTGNVESVNKSYLAQAGNAGKAYYEWLFRQKTGITGANISAIYNELLDAYKDFKTKRDGVIQYIDKLEESDKETYDKFYEYYDETKVLLDLTDPDQILEYLVTAAKDIVPDLTSSPKISFKYMDDTVSEITGALAYYMRTPIDLTDSSETITLNAYQMEQRPSDLLTTIAHEGYPGHLYAHVNAKERGASLLSTCFGALAFSEGWAQYVELALLDNIAKSSDTATAKYCEYKKYQILMGYLNMVLWDIDVNYFGATASETGDSTMIEMLMEIPAAYVPYGYGLYVMYTLHENVKTALGEKYSEADFNGVLLSEGFAPTLTRARQITSAYIKKNK